MGRKSKEGLGRALIKDRFGATRGKKKVDNNSMLHTTEVNDGYEWGRLNLQSVTAESSLQEFLSTAQLAGTEFTAEKLNLNYVNTTPVQTVRIVGNQHPEEFLTVPRRPTWVPGITPGEQDTKEKDSFLEWRRKLVNLQEKEAAALTPYERNLELWRQLWRTLEKSDLLLILLDARNPLLFRCEDLEKAAMENNSQVILLLNKADLIGEVERKLWSEYFEKRGIRMAFFSAAPTAGKEVNQAAGDLKEIQHESDEEYDESSSEDEPTLQKIDESNESGQENNETDEEPEEPIEEKSFSEDISKDVENKKSTEVEISEASNILGITESVVNKEETLDTNILKNAEEESAHIITESSNDCQNVENNTTILVVGNNNSVEDCCKIGEVNNICIDSYAPELNKNSNSNVSENYTENDTRLKIESSENNVKVADIANDTSSENEKESDKNDFLQNEIDSRVSVTSKIKNSSNILHREELIVMLKSIPVDKWKSPSQLTVGLIGYPNVGKSSTVNTLMQTKKVSVSAMPGHTRHVQSLVLDDLLLLDCPGLVLPAYAVAPDLQLTAVLPIDQMTTYEAAVQRLIDLVGREEFKTRYGLLLPESGPLLPQHLLSAHAFNRGFMTATGRPDEARSARLLLKQASSGRLRWAVLPPGVERPQLEEKSNESQTRKPTRLEARLVQGWKTPADEIDRNFFYNSKGGAHTKGTPAPGITGFGAPAASTASEKPWKSHNKHANKNKKQKLRKAYWYLDQHC